MQNDPIIATIELLLHDAKSCVSTEQRQNLVMAYGSSLIKRKAKQLYLNDMLVRRPPPIFAFIETKVCDDRVAPAITRSAAPAIEVIDGKCAVELKGSIAGTAALMGMI